MRLFAAITLDGSVRKKLARYAELLRYAKVRGNFTAPENYHITLAFIGETDLVDIAVRTIDGIDAIPFEVSIDAFGRFGNIDWIGPSVCDELVSLSRLTCNRLRCAGFDIEKREPKPHVTLIRKAIHPRGFVPPAVDPVGFTASSITLMRSDFTPNGVKYSPVYTKSLGL